MAWWWKKKKKKGKGEPRPDRTALDPVAKVQADIARIEKELQVITAPVQPPIIDKELVAPPIGQESRQSKRNAKRSEKKHRPSSSSWQNDWQSGWNDDSTATSWKEESWLEEPRPSHQLATMWPRQGPVVQERPWPQQKVDKTQPPKTPSPSRPAAGERARKKRSRSTNPAAATVDRKSPLLTPSVSMGTAEPGRCVRAMDALESLLNMRKRPKVEEPPVTSACASSSVDGARLGMTVRPLSTSSHRSPIPKRRRSPLPMPAKPANAGSEAPQPPQHLVQPKAEAAREEGSALPAQSTEGLSKGAFLLKYQLLIRGIYAKKCPHKIDNVLKIMDKYAGKERELYEEVCKKYGEIPYPNQSPPRSDAAPSDGVQQTARQMSASEHAQASTTPVLDQGAKARAETLRERLAQHQREKAAKAAMDGRPRKTEQATLKEQSRVIEPPWRR